MHRDASDEFPWQRWWAPRDASIELLEAATLPDPSTEIGSAVNPGLRLLSELSDVRAIVLLGDAGMGKSAELRAEYLRLSATSLTVAPRYLGEYGSDASIDRMFDELTPEDDDRGLALLLDGYDEALGFAPKLPELLARRLEGLAPRLSLVRLASRPSARRGRLDATLEDLFGSVEERVLAPLTRNDVRLAVEQRGIDAGAFFDALTAADAWPLAARPLTLMLLIGAFVDSGSLPPTRRELYDRQIPSLLAEHDKHRAAAGRAVPVGERVTTARELAAATSSARRSNRVSSTSCASTSRRCCSVEGRRCSNPHASDVPPTRCSSVEERDPPRLRARVERGVGGLVATATGAATMRRAVARRTVASTARVVSDTP